MTIKIDKYYMEENNGNYFICDKSYWKDRIIVKFEMESKEKNRVFAEQCLRELNTGKYEKE